MGPIKPLSLLSRTESLCPKFSYHSISIFSPNPSFPIITSCSQKLPRLSLHLPRLHASSRFSLLPIPQKPSSIFSKVSDFMTKFLSQEILISVVGACILMGLFGLNTRPSLAVPHQGARGEEKRDTQMENSKREEMYEKFLEKEPRNVETLKVLVYEKMRRGRTKEAVKYVQRFMNIEPEEVEWRLLEALCYEMMGQLSKAKRLFKEILKERPLLLRALHGLAMVMHKNLEGPAVFEMLDKALEVACREKRVTEERNIRILIAQMHVVKGELEVGLKKFQDLVNENPRDFRPYLCQGIIYSLLNKKEEAAEQFETYRSLVPEEFPQRKFLDDVVLAAKTKSQETLWKEFESEFSYRK